MSRRVHRGQRWNVKDGARELRRAQQRRTGKQPAAAESAYVTEAHVRNEAGWCVIHNRQEAVP